jgi:hypothetical protein
MNFALLGLLAFALMVFDQPAHAHAEVQIVKTARPVSLRIGYFDSSILSFRPILVFRRTIAVSPSSKERRMRMEKRQQDKLREQRKSAMRELRQRQREIENNRQTVPVELLSKIRKLKREEDKEIEELAKQIQTEISSGTPHCFRNWDPCPELTAATKEIGESAQAIADDQGLDLVVCRSAIFLGSDRLIEAVDITNELRKRLRLPPN